jgi:hypothetical protein
MNETFIELKELLEDSVELVKEFMLEWYSLNAQERLEMEVELIGNLIHLVNIFKEGRAKADRSHNDYHYIALKIQVLENLAHEIKVAKKPAIFDRIKNALQTILTESEFAKMTR